MFKHHSELLNLIAEKINAEYYLEIGVYNRTHNFDKIKCEFKLGIDPALADHDILKITSDEYFKTWIHGKHDYYDLIFIDGLHHEDQIKRDVNNAWYCLNVGGIIVIHDANPHSEDITHVPRDSREWSGDVYKAICQIDSHKFTIDFDYGCCVLSKKNILQWNDKEITWEYFDKNRKELLNLVSIEEGINLINNLC